MGLEWRHLDRNGEELRRFVLTDPADFGILAQVVLSVSAATIYAPPAGFKAVIEAIDAVNFSASTRRLRLYANGASSAHLIESSLIPKEEGWHDADLRRLGPTDYIAADASAASSVTLTIIGREEAV